MEEERLTPEELAELDELNVKIFIALQEKISEFEKTLKASDEKSERLEKQNGMLKKKLEKITNLINDIEKAGDEV